MDNKNHILIKAVEKSALFDEKGKRTKPKGYVEIYELDENKEKKQLLGKHNLLVYQGREQVAQRMLNTQNNSLSMTPSDFVCWFGVGSGGTDVDPFDPISPTNQDSDLVSSVVINLTDTQCADFVLGEGYYKHPFDSITYEEDGENDDRFLVALITTTLGEADCENTLLSEAGLFTAASNAGSYAGPFYLYARITFPTIKKTTLRDLVFDWYLFF